MPHIHFIIGLILINIIVTFINPLSDIEMILILVGSVIVDIDSLLFENHRQAPTHKPIFHLLGIIITIFCNSSLVFFFIGSFVHVTIIDAIDWNIELLYPFSNRKWSLLKLDYEKLSSGGKYYSFIKNYYHISKIIIIESIIFLFFILTLILQYLVMI